MLVEITIDDINGDKAFVISDEDYNPEVITFEVYSEKTYIRVAVEDLRLALRKLSTK